MITTHTTPTPLTDAHVAELRRNPDMSGCSSTLDFARTIERANAALKEAHADVAEKHDKLLVERDRLAMLVTRYKDSNAALRADLKRAREGLDERDQLRAEVARLKTEQQTISSQANVLIVEAGKKLMEVNDDLKQRAERAEADTEALINAGELLLEGYIGMGGHPDNNGPHFMRKAIAAARATAKEGTP